MIQILAGLLAWTLVVAQASPAGRGQPAPHGGCNAPADEPSIDVQVPGAPFLALPSADGCWVYVSLTRTADAPGRIALLKRAAGTLTVVRQIEAGSPAGMVLTHDQKLLIAASGPEVVFVDTARLTEGHAEPVLARWTDDRQVHGRVYANVTSDDRYLFVAEERARSILVFDLAAARASGLSKFRPLGRIPVGVAPIALAFSSDGRYLYSTSQSMPDLGWPMECKPENAAGAASPPNHAQGAVVTIDLARAVSTPGSSVVSTVKAGCNPVRLVLSPSGDVVYVTARNSNAVLTFDRARLVTNPENAMIGSVPTGTAPVGVAVVDGGRRIVVTNSNRFGAGAAERQSLTVIDAARVRDGAGAVLGSIAAGGFPRELRVTADGRTLLLTNFTSRTVQVIDLQRLPLQPATR